MTDSVVITGVWLRTTKFPESDISGETTKIEVLVEVNDGWRCVVSEIDALGSGPISYIVEPAGIAKAPLDTITP